MAERVETLECIGGPLDGQFMSSIGFPDTQPWVPIGIYIRTPARYAKAVVRSYRLDVLDPLTDLVADVWVWRAVSEADAPPYCQCPFPRIQSPDDDGPPYCSVCWKEVRPDV